MLDFLVSWAEQLIIALIIVIVIEMILPNDSSYRKYIKVVLGFFIMYTIMSPILSNKLNNFEFKQILAVENNTQIPTNSINTDKQIEETYKTKLKDNISEFIKEKGYETEKIDVDLEYKNEEIEIKKINLTLKKFNNKSIVVNEVVINQETKISNEDLENIKNEIGDYYDIDVTKIYVSESE